MRLHHLDNYWQLLPILRAVPGLQDLKVKFGGCWHHSNPLQEEQVVLPTAFWMHSLASLSLAIPRDAYDPWIRHLRAPNLCQFALKLDASSGDEDWGPLNSALGLAIERSGCRLTNLQLHGSSFVNFFHATPCSTTLPYLEDLDRGRVVQPKLERLSSIP